MFMIGEYKFKPCLADTPNVFSVEKSIGPLLKPRIPLSLLLNISLPELRMICFPPNSSGATSVG